MSLTCAPMTQSLSYDIILVISPTPPSQGGGFWAAEKSWSCYYQRPTFTRSNSLHKCPDVRKKKKKKKKTTEKYFSPTGRVDGHINSGDAAKCICISHPIIPGVLPGTSTLNWSVILSAAGSRWLRAGVNSGEWG